MNDVDFMRRAIFLATLGEGFTSPNPLVGAVIARNGEMVAEGYHKKFGELHAEREAFLDLEKKGGSSAGATMYVTLEPCCHFGSQPPCTDAIISSGVKKVFVGSRDPNPLVSGKGVSILRRNGIEVVEDFLKDECDELNHIFFHYISTGTPYVALKYAMTLDGKIATRSGKSRWITNDESRAFVHRLRRRYSAIMCGIGTVIKDDPMLDCRIENPRNPLRIVCDTRLRLPLESRLVQSALNIPLLAVCVSSAEESFLERRAALEEAGVEVLALPPDSSGRPLMSALFKNLGERAIDSVLVEGGAELNYSILAAGLSDRVYAFLGAKFFGGSGKSPVEGSGVLEVQDAFSFRLEKITAFSDDVLAEYTPAD